MSTPARDQALSPTTGEPLDVVARRNRLGMILITVSASTGALALFVAYSYLWSLNVNNAWAPPKSRYAADWPFWAITVGALASALALRWGRRRMDAGDRSGMLLGSLASALLVVATFAGQVLQIMTLPFGPGDGAYASCTFWLCLSNAGFLAIGAFLAFGVFNRTLAGRINRDDSSHAGFVGMILLWITVVAFLGAVFTLTMKASPNMNPPTFGTFRE